MLSRGWNRIDTNLVDMFVYLQSGTIKWKLIRITQGNHWCWKWSLLWQLTWVILKPEVHYFNPVGWSLNFVVPHLLQTFNLQFIPPHNAANPLQANVIILQCGPNIIIRWMATAHFPGGLAFLVLSTNCRWNTAWPLTCSGPPLELTAYSHRTPSPFVLRRAS